MALSPTADTSPAVAVRRALVMTNARAVALGDALVRAARIAARRDVELVLAAEEHGRHDAAALPCRWCLDDGGPVDLALALGGDGTTLRALRLVLARRAPVFAVNFGHLGFLTSAPASDADTAIDRALAGDLSTVELLALAILRDGARAGLAINDAVVAAERHGSTARLGWAVDDLDFGEVNCDAIIVSTPAGSTAYGLSAGGPVVGWGVEALCVTFLAPHSLSARSLVLPSGRTVHVTNRHESAPACLVLDGQQTGPALAPGETVSIEVAPERGRLALLPETSTLARFRDAFAPGRR